MDYKRVAKKNILKNAKNKLLELFQNKRYSEFENYLSKNTIEPDTIETNRTSLILQLQHKDTDEFFKDISENITFIPLYIQQIFNAINKDIDKLKLILNSAKNNINKFITLYNSSLIPLNEYFLMPGNEDINKLDICLYRGFQYLRYKPLLDYVDEKIKNSSKQIEIPCILSSTIYEHIAYNFLSIEDKRKIVWKINIPYSSFNKFKYSYILENWDDKRENKTIINLTNVDKTSINESEFILNYGLQLKFINKQIISKVLPRKKIPDEIELYEFEFVDYKTIPELNHLNNIIDNIITNLDTLDNKSLSK